MKKILRCWNCGGKRKELFQLKMYLTYMDEPSSCAATKKYDNICKRCVRLFMSLPNKPSDRYKELVRDEK